MTVQVRASEAIDAVDLVDQAIALLAWARDEDRRLRVRYGQSANYNRHKRFRIGGALTAWPQWRTHRLATMKREPMSWVNK